MTFQNFRNWWRHLEVQAKGSWFMYRVFSWRYSLILIFCRIIALRNFLFQVGLLLDLKLLMHSWCTVDAQLHSFEIGVLTAMDVVFLAAVQRLALDFDTSIKMTRVWPNDWSKSIFATNSSKSQQRLVHLLVYCFDKFLIVFLYYHQTC